MSKVTMEHLEAMGRMIKDSRDFIDYKNKGKYELEKYIIGQYQDEIASNILVINSKEEEITELKRATYHRISLLRKHFDHEFALPTKYKKSNYEHAFRSYLNCENISINF